MEDNRVMILLNKYHKSFEKLELTLTWVTSFLNEHPGMVEVPQELKDKIEESRLEVWDCKNMITLRLKSLGNEEESS